MASDDVLDVECLERYFSSQNPNLLNYVAVLGGRQPIPTDQPFTYCDLGCGMGLSVNLLAAGHPDGRFYGVDANSAHVAHATSMARSGGLANASFLEVDFRELRQRELPDFDFVTLHSVHSWVKEDARQALVDFLEAKVKPGGVVYLGYDTMPGWAPLLPMRDAMLFFTANRGLDTIGRVREGIAYLKLLRDKGAKYFVDNPLASLELDEMSKKDPREVAHDYFSADLRPAYFHKLVEELRRAGLAFAGTLPIHFNYDAFVISPAFGSTFSTARTREMRETHKAFVLNERYRRDVFVRASTAPSPREQRFELYREMRFTSPKRRENVNKSVKFLRGELRYDNPVYGQLLDVLTASAPTVEELVALPTLSSIPRDQLLEALELLVAGEEVVPSRSASMPADPASFSSNGPALPPALRVPSSFNTHVLRDRLFEQPVVVLVSPVLGAPVPVALSTALCMRALIDGPAHTAAERMFTLLRSLPEPLVLPGPNGSRKKLETEADVQTSVQTFLADFSAPKLANLCRLGIATVAG